MKKGFGCSKRKTKRSRTTDPDRQTERPASMKRGAWQVFEDVYAEGKPPLSKSAAKARYIYPYFFCFRNRNKAEMRVAKTSATVMAYQMPFTSNKSGRSITDAD